MRVLILAAVMAATPAIAQQPGDDALTALLEAPKFEPAPHDTDADTPKDKPALTAIVNQAIRNIQDMPEPRDPDRVRSVLTTVIEDVEHFAIEDRQQAYRYCVHIWRAAGFRQPSQLFEASDFEVLLIV